MGVRTRTRIMMIPILSLRSFLFRYIQTLTFGEDTKRQILDGAVTIVKKMATWKE